MTCYRSQGAPVLLQWTSDETIMVNEVIMNLGRSAIYIIATLLRKPILLLALMVFSS